MERHPGKEYEVENRVHRLARTSMRPVATVALLLSVVAATGCSAGGNESQIERSAGQEIPVVDRVCARLQEIVNYNDYRRRQLVPATPEGPVTDPVSPEAKANLRQIDELKRTTAERLEQAVDDLQDTPFAESVRVVIEGVRQRQYPEGKLREIPVIVQMLREKCSASMYPIDNASVLNLPL